jgi:hypothetical protein
MIKRIPTDSEKEALKKLKVGDFISAERNGKKVIVEIVHANENFLFFRDESPNGDIELRKIRRSDGYLWGSKTDCVLTYFHPEKKI